MNSEVDRDAEENRIAKEAIAYLKANELVVSIRCPKDNPPSEDVAGFLSDYFADAEADLTVEMKERIESLYPDEEN